MDPSPQKQRRFYHNSATPAAGAHFHQAAQHKRDAKRSRRGRSAQRRGGKGQGRRTSGYNPRRKSELCAKWQETGFCRLGDKCDYAHGRQALVWRSLPRKYRAQRCGTFESKNLCSYGKRCGFAHVLVPLHAVPEVPEKVWQASRSFFENEAITALGAARREPKASSQVLAILTTTGLLAARPNAPANGSDGHFDVLAEPTAACPTAAPPSAADTCVKLVELGFSLAGTHLWGLENPDRATVGGHRLDLSLTTVLSKLTHTPSRVSCLAESLHLMAHGAPAAIALQAAPYFGWRSTQATAPITMAWFRSLCCAGIPPAIIERMLADDTDLYEFRRVEARESGQIVTAMMHRTPYLDDIELARRARSGHSHQHPGRRRRRLRPDGSWSPSQVG